MVHYSLPNPLPWGVLAQPVAAAEAALARLDERIAASPIAEGFRARNHFATACAEAQLAGEFVHLEDLVLHDAGMDVRTPTAELTRAHGALRVRRRLETCRSGEAWRLAEREALGADAGDMSAQDEGNPTQTGASTGDGDLDAALAAVDAAMTGVDKALAGDAPARPRRSALVYDEDRADERRREVWREVVAETADLPAVLAAAIVADAWQRLEPVQHRENLGWSLAAALLRTRGTTRFLVGVAIGVRHGSRLRWQSPDPTTRLVALLEALAETAEIGAKDHARWLAGRAVLVAKVEGRRRNSKLPALVDYVMRTPILSANMVARELRITPQAAQTLIAELGLRELTGRSRYRAWGML